MSGTDTANTASDYAHDGYVVVRQLIPPTDRQRLVDLFDALGASSIQRSRQILYTHQPPPAERPGMLTLMDQWLFPLQAARAGDVSGIIAGVNRCVASTLRHDVVLLQDVALSKTAAHGPFPWHQDQPFWAVDRDEGAVVWVALDASGAGNGGLELARGSHLFGLGPAIDLHTGDAQHGMTGVTPEDLDTSAVCPDLEPGDAILFSSMCWHRSGVNRSGHSRRAWAFSWIHSEAKWDLAQAPRHPIRHAVADGTEVRAWSLNSYPSQRV